jgi:hypothetical protein
VGVLDRSLSQMGVFSVTVCEVTVVVVIVAPVSVIVFVIVIVLTVPSLRDSVSTVVVGIALAQRLRAGLIAVRGKMA